MMLPDVNVLVAASRPDHGDHPAGNRWPSQTMRSAEPFAVSPLVLAATVQIVTNERIFRKPAEPKEAFRFCDEIRAHRYVRLVEPSARHWEIFSRLCQSSDLTGPRVSDAWFAALSIEHGCEWITFDRGLLRFQGASLAVTAIGHPTSA